MGCLLSKSKYFGCNFITFYFEIFILLGDIYGFSDTNLTTLPRAEKTRSELITSPKVFARI